MDIIPVLDLKDGQAVHARQGQRDAYRPLRTPLCPDSAPAAVVRRYLSLFPFKTVYIADLDAIQARGDNGAAIAAIAGAFPDLRLWVDSGLATPAACRDWHARDLGTLVLGSESQQDLALIESLRSDATNGGFVLSLDFKGDSFLGPPALLERPDLWPHDVIVMTLARVGSGSGPDLDRLRAIAATAPGRRLHAAGGVRDASDLTALHEMGIAGALVATCLHDGRVGPADIAAVVA